ncbi:oxidoreductase [Roseibium aquae]|uniref:Oxidoreductase n=1 Tax=Roseibium aquae TaxID=1323746 RepID=A0A916TLU3_9HYPH|nr:Gfo/Idh/MocA family oxidoreductase [Roseibium aquae]GGB53652.1 oxidoreductase [Roseibium aquae]
MSGKLGLAVIGTGMAALPHARALKDLQDLIEVKGVYSRTQEKRFAFAQEHGFPEAAALEQLVADPDVHAALIITPPNQRQALVETFARAGKHILMEKPVERTTGAAEGLVRMCEAAKVQLGIVFQHRFREVSRTLKSLIDAGDLGEIGMVRVSVPWWRAQAYYDEPGRGSYERDGGGVLISQAIHTLDLMLSMTGPVSEVQAVSATTRFHKMEAEDFVAGGLRFASGAVGSVMATTASFPGDAESITLDGTRASAHLQSGVLTVRYRDGRVQTWGETAGTGGGADPMAFPHGWHRDLIRSFASRVLAGEPVDVSGREALHVHRLIDALVQSSKDRRAVTID